MEMANMTGPKKNSDPQLIFRVEGKQNSLFPEGAVIKCFVIPPNSKKKKKKTAKKDLLDLTPTVLCPHYEWQSKLTFPTKTSQWSFSSQLTKYEVKVALAPSNA